MVCAHDLKDNVIAASTNFPDNVHVVGVESKEGRVIAPFFLNNVIASQRASVLKGIYILHASKLF